VRPKLTIFGLVFPIVVVLDVITKRWALEALAAQRGELFGGLIPLTLAFNRGAAFGISIGDDSRWLFVPITIAALGLLGFILTQTDRKDYPRILAISLVVSGAVGNLYDRVRWSRGVVDFLGPIDLGIYDFPIFNVADIAISCGAVLLAWSFLLEERAEKAAAAAKLAAVEGEPGPEPEPTP
jgi:signal peptidase II